MNKAKFNITIKDHQFIGEKFGEKIFVNQVFKMGVDIDLWNKRIGYAESALRLERWEAQIKTFFKKQ